MIPKVEARVLSKVANVVKGLVIVYALYVLIAAPLNVNADYGGPVWSALFIAVLLAAAFAALLRVTSVRSLLDVALGADKCAGLDQPDAAPESPRTAGDAWFLGGLAVLLACFTLLEVRQPFFFTQDDNFAWGLPLVLHGCRSLVSGVFCTWDPYQLLGAPTSSMAQSVLTYPPTYIAYVLARYVLRNEYLTIDVMAIGHLVLGYYGVYRLCRYVGVRPILSSAGGLAFALSGFALIMGRSWFHTISVSTWTVFLMLSAVRIQREPATLKWMVWTGVVIGVSFHAGYPQLWAYSVMLFLSVIAALVLTKAVRLRKAAVVIPVLLLGLAVSAPLLVPQLMEASHIYAGRTGGYGQGIQVGSPSLLLPYPLAKLNPEADNAFQEYGPSGWGSTNYEYMGEFYYSGTFFYLVALMILLCSVTYRWNRRLVGNNLWLVFAFIALMGALGAAGGLWPLLAKLPFFNKFTGPFKLLGYVNLFAILGSGLAVERLLRRARRSHAWEIGIGLAVAGLLAYHCALPLPAFYSYGDRPYPKLPTEMTKLIADSDRGFPQRVASIAPIRNVAVGYVSSLCQNFATVYGIMSYQGYDPLVSATPENRRAQELFMQDPSGGLEAYGIRWILYFKNPVTGLNYHELSMETSGAGERPAEFADLRLDLPDIEIWEVGHVRQMAFAESDMNRAFPVHVDGAGVRADVSDLKEGGPVVINFLRRPWTAASVDGKPTTVRADAWGRIVTDVPPGSRRVEVRYSPPWGIGFATGAALALLAAMAWALLARSERRASAKIATPEH